MQGAIVHVRTCQMESIYVFPDSKFHGANMGPMWGRQDPGGSHVGPMIFAIWVHNTRVTETVCVEHWVILQVVITANILVSIFVIFTIVLQKSSKLNIASKIWLSTDNDDMKAKSHDDVVKWKHFPRYWPFTRRNHRSPVNSPHKDQWHGALMFSSISVWTNGWVNNGDAGV